MCEILQKGYYNYDKTGCKFYCLSIYQHFVHFSYYVQLFIILKNTIISYFFFLPRMLQYFINYANQFSYFVFIFSKQFHIMTAVRLSWNADILYKTRNKRLRLCWRLWILTTLGCRALSRWHKTCRTRGTV